MKVSSRIILGFGILILLEIGGLAYQVTIIHSLQSSYREVSAVNFRSASIVLRMLGETRDLEEFSRKYFATSGDPVYDTQLANIEHDFAKDLEELQATVRSDSERHQTAQLVQYWEGFQRTLEIQKLRAPVKESDSFPSGLSDDLMRLQVQTQIIYTTVQESISDEVARVGVVGREAERFSWFMAVAGLLIGVIVAVVIVKAITEPLGRLTQGTHKIAKGHFWHRLPVPGQDEFSQLARDFNIMTEKLSELDQMKKDFVSHVSHDLKAPLASMRQIYHILLNRVAGPLSEQQARLLRLGSGSAERLSAMVGNLLDASRMEAGAMEYEIGNQDLVALVRSAGDEFEVQAQEKGIHLSVAAAHAEILVDCDRARITQVIGNLLENALKFSPGNAEIVARVRRDDRGFAEVAVMDSGPGVPAIHRKDIFEKFHQIQQNKKLTGQGVGLGLTICKTIVEAHQGEIWVEDNPAGGSVFCFVLPGAKVNDARATLQA